MLSWSARTRCWTLAVSLDFWKR